MSDREAAHPYERLTPDSILNAVESLGLRCDGRLLALNSFENRVYQVGLEDAAPVVAKFYRPERWSTEQILEEHAFALELAQAEIPVVAPMAHAGRTLHEHRSFRFALFPKQSGRAPDLETQDTIVWMGRFLGRIHAVGAVRPFARRRALDVASFAEQPSAFLLERGFIPPDLTEAYRTLVEHLIGRLHAAFELDFHAIRLHGDCHAGNVLWDEGPFFVDLDDSCMGPAVQDLWMLLSGEREERERQLGWLLDGYFEFHDFDPRELRLIEALRTLRMIHYAGWLARRWDDPAFPSAFPWFNTQRYWQDHILALREQAAALDEPPLSLSR
jgi:Ser/Thr protein kinase RdoA (MazF antagonist)